MGWIGGRFGVTLGSLLAYEADCGFPLVSFWGHILASRRRMACVMCIVAGLMVSLLVPNGSINKLYSFLRKILLVTEATGTPGKVLRTAEPERWEGVGGGLTLPLGAWFGGFGGLEGLMLVRSIYTP